MNLEQLISEALRLPISAIDYHVSQLLKTHFPDKVFIEGADGLFNVEEYAQAQLCKLETKGLTYNQMMTYWRGPETGIMDWNRNVMRIGAMFPMATSHVSEREAQNFAK